MIPRDFYKKPIFYYIFIPACIALWPCLTELVYLPKAKKAYTNELKIYADANTIMFNILSIDDRSKGATSKNSGEGFDYYKTINAAANASGISSPTIKTEPIRTMQNKRFQEATVTLPGTRIEFFANFMFFLQKRWATLECESIVLNKEKALPNVWKPTIRFRYYL
jgi:hypothetical protein